MHLWRIYRAVFSIAIFFLIATSFTVAYLLQSAELAFLSVAFLVFLFSLLFLVWAMEENNAIFTMGWVAWIIALSIDIFYFYIFQENFF